jgi:hypothetical protein
VPIIGFALIAGGAFAVPQKTEAVAGSLAPPCLMHWA